MIFIALRVVGLWKEKLSTSNPKAAQSLADPAEYENLFPGLQEAIVAEEALRKERGELHPASRYPDIPVSVAEIIGHSIRTEV